VIDEHDIEIGPDRGEKRSLTVTPIGAPKGRASAPRHLRVVPAVLKGSIVVMCSLCKKALRLRHFLDML
jgi:hypothetical protein